MSLHFNESFLKKLRLLNESTQSVQTLSLWIIHYRKMSKVIVESWFNYLLQVSEEKMLILMYLANDVIQTSVRKGPELKTAFSAVLPKAFGHIGNTCTSQKLLERFVHILDVWQLRVVYNSAVIAKYRRLLIDIIDDDKSGIQRNDNYGASTAILKDGHSSRNLSYASKLIEALNKLKYSPSHDMTTRTRLLIMSEKLLETDRMASKQGRAVEIDLQKLTEADEELDIFNARLKTETEDRKELDAILRYFKVQQLDKIRQGERNLREYEKKLHKLRRIQNDVRINTQNLPDISFAQLPLPTAAELFQH